MNTQQYEQIALAMLALEDTNQKANLVRIVCCNFLASDRTFDGFKFVQLCYVRGAELTPVNKLRNVA